MTISLSHFRRRDVRAFAAGLLLFAILFRTIIPPGYMPDLEALKQGLFQISICTAQGAANLLVGAKDLPQGEPSGEKQQAEACPYLLSGSAFLLALSAPEFFSQSFLPLMHSIQRASVISTARHFGNASPRSPPAAA
jgi:hypothetical protein